MHFRTILLLCAILLIQGCAVAVVAGTAGAVSAANDRRTIGSQIDDNSIEIKATLALKQIPRLAKHANINVVSVNGTVLLTGQVANTEMRSEANNAVNKVMGVKRLLNQIRIGSNIGLSTQTHDTWLTSKVKTQLLANDNVNGSNIKVITENAEVFLMGMVDKDEAEKAVDIARNIHGVERVIKAFEYL
ncbi:BON domain-containing protein [Pseudoalteromonas luteoviolacea]|uniref:BON domain-containing protein n=1 Tax=Pseudoalteromonas luteoviolacea TaxID=43657 RepID=A0A1C0TN06_9GAMM|nr:division/outer membrane stress-associated lipid-binding lipoprotein [Pseudoalteromonas luteoviolacea]MBQ4812100.1 divisome-associated lipoprotein YraP [Pseudoalteromonas luteoviolacea]OCQ20229.1 BON domain-containing protein [Pseudoalteromonas luteoviolacea]